MLQAFRSPCFFGLVGHVARDLGLRFRGMDLSCMLHSARGIGLSKVYELRVLQCWDWFGCSEQVLGGLEFAGWVF